jgi:hypothetical protein
VTVTWWPFERGSGFCKIATFFNGQIFLLLFCETSFSDFRCHYVTFCSIDVTQNAVLKMRLNVCSICSQKYVYIGIFLPRSFAFLRRARDNFFVLNELLLGAGGAQRGEALLQHVGLLQEDLQSRGILWHVPGLCRSADKLFLPFFLIKNERCFFSQNS